MQETTELKLTAAQERELIRQLGWQEYIEFTQIATVPDLCQLAEQYIAERKAVEEPLVTVLQPKRNAIPLLAQVVARAASPKLQTVKRVIQIEVITQDFDDLHVTDEYHDVESGERLYFGSFNTKTKRVVFRGMWGGEVIGTAVTPNGNPIKSSEGDGIYTDKAAGAQWMYVAVTSDGRKSVFNAR